MKVDTIFFISRRRSRNLSVHPANPEVAVKAPRGTQGIRFPAHARGPLAAAGIIFVGP
ncbi:hypothetical protein KHC23_06815 [Ancylobacter dichloromethanicus]|uniref:hypothetical protein n=1 Tax=Ancylobacter dichloromethanicus TaxID=518825 RepID=UPI001BCAF8F7|nr:hypothetical protein [Ancylobacter dichloromethanicus]MBS7553358.1 hypothetical protein [Ancylobacter dichloromethanicus]